MNSRTDRERRTLSAMIAMYCYGHHGAGALCETCAELEQYALQRLDVCPFHSDKPTCAVCTVHCYSQTRREQVRQVMRFSGPRMAWRHPVLSLYHFLDGRRPTPALPAKKQDS